MSHITHISGWSLFKYELAIEGKVRTCERWQPTLEIARADAAQVARDWADGRNWSVRNVREVSREAA
jgi:hypothetical protein